MLKNLRMIFILLIAAAILPIFVTAKHTSPIVIGHRGASGYRPEHTLASYELAIQLGADFVEPDLVCTKDGILVARHENEISGTTDVAIHPEFASRSITKTIDGTPIKGWFTEDFTLAELKTLKCKERIPDLRPANTAYNGLFQIATLQEVIDLVKRMAADRHRRIGIYPETKHPTYFDSIGLSLEERLVDVLHKNGYRSANSPVFIQSFEVANLRELRRMTRLPLVQLIDSRGRPFDFVVSGDPRTYADLITPQGLAGIAGYAQGIGANKNLIIPRDTNNRLLPHSSLIRDAHKAGLIVHAWTFRDENAFLAEELRRGDRSDSNYQSRHGDIAAEYKLFFKLGVDGVFSDHPDSGVAVRNSLFK